MHAVMRRSSQQPRAVAAVLALACTILTLGTASACSLAGLELEVEFRPDNSSLDTDQLLRFVQWHRHNLEGNTTTRGIEELLITARAIEQKGASYRLASMRIDNLIRLIKIGRPGFSEIKSDIYQRSASALYAFEGINTVAVSLQPVCAKSNSCCGNMEGTPSQGSRRALP